MHLPRRLDVRPRHAALSLLLVLAAAPATGCGAPKADVVAMREQLMQADRDFDTATHARGVDGWLTFFAPTGRQVTTVGPMVIGAAAIREYMSPVFADSTLSLRWEPEVADVAASGDLGYTIGHSRRVKRAADGTETLLAEGRYLTVWQRQADGSWKVAADIGNSRPVTPPKSP
jgi:uncharacterized protein (TIGR02246 family)